MITPNGKELEGDWERITKGLIKEGDWLDDIKEWAMGLIGQEVGSCRGSYQVYRRNKDTAITIRHEPDVMDFTLMKDGNDMLLKVDRWNVFLFKVEDGKIHAEKCTHISDNRIATDSTGSIVVK